MHDANEDLRAAAHQWASWAVDRAFDGPIDIGTTPGTVTSTPAITETGLGHKQAWQVWRDEIAPANLSLDSTRFMAYLPIAPTPVATTFDMVVSAAALGAESWQEAAGAVHAENETLAWLAREFGLPATTVGCFVSGGSAGNLSALAVARDRYRHRTGRRATKAVMSAGTHSCVANALRLLDIEPVLLPGQLLDPTKIDANLLDGVCVIVSTAGTTNAGLIDDLDGLAAVAKANDVWLHVDAAYGGGAAIAPSMKEAFIGLGEADSIVVDPHKWLFGPLDCCALLYRDASDAQRTHRQHASYLDALQTDDVVNPSDLAFHLTRRARGLPLWMSLAVHGVAAYRTAIEHTLTVTKQAAELIKQADHLELIMEPKLSILLVRRTGWTPENYDEWSRKLATVGTAFVVPTVWESETVARFATLHPHVSLELFTELFDSMK
jgi:glutamate/tyrosine decarboxylase-like PLP-dependent enzyme